MKRSVFKSVVFALVVVSVLAGSMVACFAEGSGEAVSAVSTVLEGVTGTINISSIVQILGIAIAASVGLVLMWFGVRFVIRKVMGAVRKGKM